MGSRSNGNGFKVPLIGQQPVEQRLKLQHLNTPNAFPVSQIVPEPDGAKLMLFGGLTKLEWMSGLIASGDEMSDDFSIVDRAASILAECQERMNAAQNPITEETTNGEVL